MKAYRIYEWCQSEEYGNPVCETTLGYYTTKEKAEANSQYQEYIQNQQLDYPDDIVDNLPDEERYSYINSHDDNYAIRMEEINIM